MRATDYLPEHSHALLASECGFRFGNRVKGRLSSSQLAGRRAQFAPWEKFVVSPDNRDPRHHTQKMQTRFQEMIDHLRADINKVDEPQLKAMFETSAEVLGGLTKASATTSRRTKALGASDI